ncbi:MAG: ribosome maturation factor RimM [Treponema sp.]|nr:ribosome maturation factor RimM [Treponema sp.]
MAALVGPPFGITGRVKIRSLSGETGHLLALDRAVLRLGGREQVYTIEEFTPSPPLMKFAGIDSPEAAGTLRGAEILVDRSQAAPLGEGEFYIEDLKGLKVFVQAQGGPRFTGEITGIIEGGGGFLAEITLPGGEKKLVPFRNEFFGPIDTERGRAELLQDWILDT